MTLLYYLGLSQISLELIEDFSDYPVSNVLDNNVDSYYHSELRRSALWFVRLKKVQILKWILISIRGGNKLKKIGNVVYSMFSCLSCSRVKDFFKNGPTSVAILKFMIWIKQLILIIISILSKKSALSNYKSNFIIAKLILSKYNNGFICTGPDYVDQRFEFLIYYT